MTTALLSTSENHFSCFPQKKEAACCVLWKQCLSLYLEIENIGNRQIKVVMMDEALAFFRLLPQKVQEKISYNFLKIEQGVIDKELFKKLVGTNIWEFRTLFNGNCYRLFSFWDTELEALVIATHGIVKKSQKTPAKEIAKAEEIRKWYFEQKHKK
mgnify:CR=1 FL=1